MLYRFEDELRGATVRIADGAIGSVSDFQFNDHDWVARYLVVDTGTWLPGRLVVISPASISRFDRESRVVHVGLTREQIANSPGIGSDQSLEPEQEAAVNDYYGWPMFGPLLPALPYPVAVAKATEHAIEPRLRSAGEVANYYIHARDGDLGHVYDYILEDFIWTVRYLAIDTRNWWPGKKVLVSPTWIHQVDWAKSTVHVDLTKETIQNSPEYYPNEPVTREYENRLWTHYDHVPYWQ